MAHHKLVGAPAPGLAAPKRLDDRDHALLRSLGVAAAPPDVEAPQAGDDGAGRGRDQENRHADFASDEAKRKATANLQARAAMAGWTLHELAGGGYLVTRWSWCKLLPDLGAVAALLRLIGDRP